MERDERTICWLNVERDVTCTFDLRHQLDVGIILFVDTEKFILNAETCTCADTLVIVDCAA